MKRHYAEKMLALFIYITMILITIVVVLGCWRDGMSIR